ncbi:MAG TPA: hypothetical protein EYN67_13110 [Flavobacteriales bacterium]|nr:hypothetical protein [Flavobacteriales bacterium]
MNQKEEKTLRENIRHMVRYVKQKRSNEEDQLRSIIRSFCNDEIQQLVEGQTPDVSPTPNKSTGINVLEDLLKKIIPVLEMDYKLLTTDDQQRQSFRAHIVNAVVSTLTPVETNTKAGDEAAAGEGLDEEINIEVGDEADDKFIDIRTDAEKTDEEEPEDPRQNFGSGLETHDETGRNMAYQTFKKLETNIIDSYELLSNAEDQELFYDYLIANLKLYFDKFEGELTDSVDEPTNQAYDMAKDDAQLSDEPAQDASAEAGLDVPELGGEEDIELDF